MYVQCWVMVIALPIAFSYHIWYRDDVWTIENQIDW